jgi:ribosome biogenesis GTPase A
MVAARKKAAETLKRADVVIEVVDARLPGASSNPMIAAMRRERQRPCLKVLNKADLADPAVTRQWLDFFDREAQVKAVAISCRKRGDVARIPAFCKALAPHRDSPLKPLRMLIMGVPNTGKSTLVNALLKSRTAAVGDEPAITKDQREFDLSDRMILIDTPGLTWPMIERQDDGFMLAASHAISRNAMIEWEVAVHLAGILLARYPELLAARYGLPLEGRDAPGVLEGIAGRRALRAKGGTLDLERAALVLLQDYRSGAVGRITLETPESRALVPV